ncbi:hypothetical protein [uncultured Campylobacter sp.]|uniref:hypothetical protein n=1 Tax=uncultured Campylobacter sp. TaxID=218934 RepID=UPI002612261F|nr:hypothetical protein [uncultured Campylobacter sp.]
MTDKEKLPNIVSYWKLEEDFILYDDGDFFVIYGVYNRKKSEEKPGFALGICWKGYPVYHNVLCPTVLDEKTSKIILSGLSSFAVMQKDIKKLEIINKLSSKLFKD